MSETLSSMSIYTKLERIAKQARDAPEMVFTTLAHHIDIEWLREAHRRTRKGGARGVDVFANECDARRVMNVLPKRFGKYGLACHPNKTRLVKFLRPPKGLPKGKPQGTGTFDLLGFTHYWGRSRKGNWVVKRKPAKDRLRRAIRRASVWFCQHLHDPVRQQWRRICAALRGHDAYYGITGNYRMLARYHHAAKMAWRKWLDRRSNRARMNWRRMDRLLERYPLPAPRIVHRFPPSAANP